MRCKKALAVALFVSAGASTAVAETINNRADFTAVAGSLTTLDFEGIAPEGGYKYFGSLALSGVTFTGENRSADGTITKDVWVFDDGFGGGYYTTGSGAALIGGLDTYTLDGVLTASFGAGVRAIGTDFTTQVATSYLVTFSDGSTISGLSPGNKNTTFVGIIADQDIASIAFTNRNGGYSTIDNFSFGAGPVAPLVTDSVHPAPLPAAVWGGMALIAGLGVTKRLRRRRSDTLDA